MTADTGFAIKIKTKPKAKKETEKAKDWLGRPSAEGNAAQGPPLTQSVVYVDDDAASVLTASITQSITEKARDGGAVTEGRPSETLAGSEGSTGSISAEVAVDLSLVCLCGRTLKSKGGLTRHQRHCAAGAKLPDVPSEIPANIDVESTDPAAADLRPNKKRKTKKTPEPSEDPLPPDFPTFFADLEQQFRCLNTVHSFCQVQRQMVCTHEGLKRSVKRLSGRKLTLADLGAMRAIAPPLMTLYWAERQELEDGTIREMIDPDDPDNSTYLLVIEFTDARPVRVYGKRKLVDTGGHQIGWKSVSLNEQTAASGKSHAVPTLVDRRNRNFREFMMNFVGMCLEEKTDPVEKVRDLALGAVPTEPNQLHYTNTAFPDSNLPSDLPAVPTSLVALIEDLKKEPFYDGQIVDNGLVVQPHREAEYEDSNNPLSDEIAHALREASGIERLYTHQAQAINAVEEGFNIIVSTSTSSGKSLIYQLPVLRALERDPNVRAMFIFPTKALAQDQKRALLAILTHCPHLQHVLVDTYDGDTSLSDGSRGHIRENANVIFTNPDMLHVAILPGHKQWKGWLENLRFVIVDELHYYSGTFGCHAAMVMRRLRRLCHTYANDDTKFISCSATVANPEEHMSQFFGLAPASIRVISADGSPTGRKLHIIWNPPLKTPSLPSQGRRSALDDTVKLLAHLIHHGVRTICFARVRRMCEILLKELHTHLREHLPHLIPKAMSYRGGYNPADRRLIEQKMFNGELLCIVATNALELGVDIGSLDAVLHLGFPFNLASYRQQSGRAGRRERDSMSVMVCDGDSPLDQFYASRPDELFGAEVETSGVDLGNELVVDAHLQCAAWEWPLAKGADMGFLGDLGVVESLCGRYLRWDDTFKVFFPHAKYTSHPSRQISLRSIDEDHYRVIDVTTHRDIEDVEMSRVPFTLYEGSVFIQQGRSYIVFEVDADKKLAKVRPTTVDYVTANRDFTDVDPIQILETREVVVVAGAEVSSATAADAAEAETPPHEVTQPPPPIANYGLLRLQTTVFGYFKLNPRTKQILEAVDGLENPPITKHRAGFWVDVPHPAVTSLKERGINVEFSVHAAAHALLGLLPTCVVIPTTGQTDIRTDCKHPRAGRFRVPRIIIYDSSSAVPTTHDGMRTPTTTGGGLVYKAFRHIPELLRRAWVVVRECPCEDGCPGCVHRAGCKEGNGALSKKGAGVVLGAFCGEVSR
ncbi:uncharacterized protein EV422DRAFT_132826 [Fimicolochytrium jonesii]|uniref:uncharacterized protein n=1 Tax=Fimicolochytrium jonesii TaxID=1396493 RepID=UPI0022FE6904|nr:uncharacterized protein EV422DRAFT_132826 [Fimicolochytrium jonesii]KAI8825600.1 hypothetical protein EV422DRAFT_132826 [Fimicolochytrium jonesii]